LDKNGDGVLTIEEIK